MKVVWICHFSNHEIQQLLGLKHNVREFAPWISELIKAFQNEGNIELHIVSPHRYISKTVVKLESLGIKYYFFNPGIPKVIAKWPSFFPFDRWTNYFVNNKRIEKIVDLIKPDIIHLHGLENPYYSRSALKLSSKYKILGSIQGFIGLSPSKNITAEVNYRIRNENKLIEKINNFGVMANFMPIYISHLNSKAKFYLHQYPTKLPTIDRINIDKQYDFVFFARITKQKGIEDFILALNKYYIKNGPFKAAIIGNGSKEYIVKIKQLIEHYKLTELIKFYGFLPTQEDVYKVVASAKMTILPTYNDIIPGTIVESMFLNVPVISYAVGGIVDLNKDEQTLHLVTSGDVDGILKGIEQLLYDKEYYTTLQHNGIQLVRKHFQPKSIAITLMQHYENIINA